MARAAWVVAYRLLRELDFARLIAFVDQHGKAGDLEAVIADCRQSERWYFVNAPNNSDKWAILAQYELDRPGDESE